MRVLSYCVFCTYLFSYQCYCGCSCKGSNGNNNQKGELTQTHESVIRLKIDKDLKLYNDKEKKINGIDKLKEDKLRNVVISPIDNILKNFNHRDRNIINLLKYAFHIDEKLNKTEKEKEEDNAKGAFLNLAKTFLTSLIKDENKREKFFKIFKVGKLPNDEIYRRIIEDIFDIVGGTSTSTLKEIFDYLLKLKLPSDFYFNIYDVEENMVFLLSKSTYEFARTVINSKFFNNIDELEQNILNLTSICKEVLKYNEGDTKDLGKDIRHFFKPIAYIFCNFFKSIINKFAFSYNIQGLGEYYLIYIPKQVGEYLKTSLDDDTFENFIKDFEKEFKDTYDIIFSDKYTFETIDEKKLNNISETKMADIYNDHGEFKFNYYEENNKYVLYEETVLSHDDIKEMSEYLNMNPQDLINEIKHIKYKNLDKFIYDKFMDSIKNLYNNMVNKCNTAKMILNNKLKIELNLKTDKP